jgi:hypothetical protein
MFFLRRFSKTITLQRNFPNSLVKYKVPREWWDKLSEETKKNERELFFLAFEQDIAEVTKVVEFR